MKKSFMALCALGILFANSAAAQVVGKIDYMEGGVTITRNGASLARADIGTAIENLDLIKTAADSLVSIVFDRASGLTGSVQIVAGSTAIIRQDQLSGTTANEVQLMTGSVNLKVKRLAGVKSAVQVKTPTSVLGVRGTEFVVASFNGTALVACEEGEVFCSSYSEVTTTRSSGKTGKSAVPGTLVEVLESGQLNTGAFPAGDFDDNWASVQNKWKTFNVELVVADPLTFLNQFVTNWSLYSAKVESGAATLRSNAVLQKWLRTASSSASSGTMSDWIKERPVVMKDLIAIRPDMVIAMITMYRIQELVPYLPESSMNRVLMNGQTVKSFVAQFNRSSKAVADASSLFYAAEKQYMLRNDGLSPFMEF